MKLHQLDHLIRSVGAITESTEVLVIGSQAVLPQLRRQAAVVSRSIEADFSSLPGAADVERFVDLVDGAIGEASIFNDSFGYYAQGVAPTTAMLPNGWCARAVRYSNDATRGVSAILPEKHDIAASKLAAGREKDIEFVEELSRIKEVDIDLVLDRIKSIPNLPPPRRNLALQRGERIKAGGASN